MTRALVLYGSRKRDFRKFLMLAVCLLTVSSSAFAADGWASMNGGTTGGAGGTIVVVTTAAALKAYAEKANVPYIIQVLGTIDLSSVAGGIKIKSNKTIMGLNTSSTIIGRLGFPQTAPYSSNIIIEGLNITNPSYAEADGISVKQYVTNLFITKCTVYDCGDGCIDISNASDFVTVSWCKFYYSNPAPAEDHRFVNLFSSSDTATGDRNKLRITFHHNWWADRCDQRMPRGRFGKVHVYNNYYGCPGNLYCVGVGVESQIRVESNYFDGVNNAWENFNTSGYNPGKIGWNSDNQFVNGSTEPIWAPNDYNDPNNVPLLYSYTLDDGADVKSLVMAGAGNLTPPLPEPPDVKWTQRYNGTAGGSSYAKDIVVDSAGNVIVSGYEKNTTTNYDFATIKYTPGGSPLWTRTYNRASSNPDYAMAVALDANSNIIVAGYGYIKATGYDGIIVKYNPAGSELWTASCNYSGASSDRFYDVATDSNGNIYAIGRKNDDCLIAKYTPAGSLVWARSYNGSANDYDSFYQLAVDANGNVYACGESAEFGSDQDCLTAKYSPDGTLLWVRTYNGPVDGWDLLEAISLDSAGNVYVTGSVETVTDSDYVTIKYLPDGDINWTAFYTDTTSGWDEAYAIAITSDDNVVVTGYSQGPGTADTATVKYNSQTGTQLWAVKYSGTGNLTDYAEAIATDYLGNIYIHGRSAGAGSTDYLTICYDSDGMLQWKMNYDGPASLTDIGTAMAVDGNSIYVTGYSMNSTGNYDYATTKYTSTRVTGEVDTSTRHQVLEGFGAAGAWYEGTLVTLGNSNPNIYNVLFRDLGLDIYRLRNAYDESGGIGYINSSSIIVSNAASSLGHPIKILVSCWSAPGYLKTNGNTVGGTLAKDFNDPNNGSSGYVYQRFAQWWYNSIIYFNNYGIRAEYINMQNEPDWLAGWDTCKLTPTESSSWAGYNLAFQALSNKIATLPNPPKLLAPETAGFIQLASYINALFDRSPLYGYSHHLYNSNTGGSGSNPDGFIGDMTSFASQFSDKPRMQTEFSAGETTFTDAMNLAKLMHNSLTVEDAAAYFHWDLFWGTSGTGLVSITSSTYTINPVYYAFKHYSAFTDPNWQRLEAKVDSNTLKMSAYISPDNNQMSIVIINTSDTSATLNLSLGDFNVKDSNVYRTSQTQNCVLIGKFDANVPLSLPAKSITTIALTGTLKNCLNPPAGDLNDDCQVDFSDFALLADGYDGSMDDRLLLKDIADTWLDCGLANPADCWQ